MQQVYDTAAALLTNNPVDTASKIVEGVTHPYFESVENGRPGEAVGRGIVDAALLVAGAGLAARLAKALNALRHLPASPALRCEPCSDRPSGRWIHGALDGARQLDARSVR